MDHKKAIDVLLNLQKKRSLTEEEKEAVSSAIGILSWTSLAKNRLKARKEKLEKDTKW
jgi:hypothetical protein